MMDRGGAGISWQCATSGNDYKQPDDRTDSSKSGRYWHGSVRQVNAPLTYIQKRNEYRASDGFSANHAKKHSIKPVHDFNALITQERMDYLLSISARYSDRYDGKKHSQFATLIKQYTSASRRPLHHSEQRQLIPLLHNFKATSGWTWRSLTTTLHSFTSAGVFTINKCLNKGSKEAQEALLSTLLDAVIRKCNQEPETWDIDVQGVANLLWALAKLVSNGQKLEKTPKLKEAVAALLPLVKTKAESKEEKDDFIPQHISSLLWAVAKLVDNGLELKKTPKLKEVVAALLPLVKTKAESKEEKDHFIPQHISNLLWAVAKLVDNGLEKTPKLKGTVATLLPLMKANAESKEEKDHFNTQATANLLWTLAKLVDNGLEKVAQFQEAVAALLPHVTTKAESKEEKDHFNTQEVASLLWALAKLLDNGLEPEKTQKLKEAVVALLSRVKAKAESQEEKDHFNPQDITNLLWASAKLVDNGLELEKTPKLKQVVAALLPHVTTKAESKEQKDRFIPQHIANLLWAMAKLVDNGLKLKKIPKLKEAVAALLLHVKTKAESKEEKDHFNTQAIANLLWALAKLVDNGLELEKTPKLKQVVAALLPHVTSKAESKEQKDRFIPQHIANLLWALAKLVDNGLELEKTAKLKEALATLLYHVKTKAESKEERDRFKPQGVANLLWALAKLVDNGLELEKTAKLKETLAALLYHVKTTAESKEERDHFNTQGTVNLLWAMAKLGEAIELNLVKSMFGSLADRISETPQLSLQNTWMSLWGAMVFCARLYLYFGRDNKNPLEKHIGELFSRLGNTSPNNIEAQTVIAMAASWLGRPCPVVPYYQTIISQSQSTFCEQLRLSLPSLQIEEEKSLNSLPPVDLQLPDYNTVIDVQGPSHYVSGDFKIRNGSTLLKVALLKKLGFEVIEIPVNKLGNQDSMKIVIEQIKEKLAVLSEPHGSVSLSSGEWAADETYFTADEGGQFSDDCYFTAEEYLEEQINKPKKRKRKRKKASKN
ncbi:DUF1601 domain-containing protein [Endozoicomonas acroporae]|uniref:DUF1601 domain-containing protein n=1 Tax=Endozoicomonas acroporae TaxID=1701104 RepID=UPI003F8C109A